MVFFKNRKNTLLFEKPCIAVRRHSHLVYNVNIGSLLAEQPANLYVFRSNGKDYHRLTFLADYVHIGVLFKKLKHNLFVTSPYGIHKGGISPILAYGVHISALFQKPLDSLRIVVPYRYAEHWSAVPVP